MMPPDTLFILIFREEQNGSAHKTFVRAGALLNCIEQIEADKKGERNPNFRFDCGPYDVYVATFPRAGEAGGELAIAPYDVGQVRKALRKAAGGGALAP